MLPAVILTELNGATGVSSAGKPLLAIVGCSSTGTAGVVGSYAKKSDVQADFGVGPLVEAACYAIEAYRKPVLIVKTTTTTAGAITAEVGTFADPYQAVDFTGVPNDAYAILIRFVTAGTIGVAGITYQISRNNGLNWGPVLALGTSASIVITGTGLTATFEVGQGIAVTDSALALTSAPLWNITNLGAALDALGATAVKWRIVEIVGKMTSSDAAAVDLVIQGLSNDGIERAWMGHAREPDVLESEAAYLASLATAFAGVATNYGSVAAGRAFTASGVDFTTLYRPPNFSVAPRQAAISEEEDSAAIDLGALPGVGLRDINGNPVAGFHDEAANPGLDDARFLTLRTWQDLGGVYVTNPRLMSAAGSDFEFMQHRLVMAIAKEALLSYLRRRLSKPVVVNKDTGFITEEEALEIEAGGTAVLRGVLLAKPKASAVEFTISRTDNLLSTKTMTGQARITPLAYPKSIEIDIGFSNPALQLQVTL